jgi:hypothetical protein
VHDQIPTHVYSYKQLKFTIHPTGPKNHAYFKIYGLKIKTHLHYFILIVFELIVLASKPSFCKHNCRSHAQEIEQLDQTEQAEAQEETQKSAAGACWKTILVSFEFKNLRKCTYKSQQVKLFDAHQRKEFALLEVDGQKTQVIAVKTRFILEKKLIWILKSHSALIMSALKTSTV